MECPIFAVITSTGRSSMGEIDVVICEYIADNERIADLFNGLYFQGEMKIRAENIEDYEEKYPVRYPSKGKRSKRNGIPQADRPQDPGQ